MTNIRYRRCGACNINWPISEHYKRCRQCDVPTAVCFTLDPRTVLSEREAKQLIDRLNREGLVKDKSVNIEEFERITSRLFDEEELEKFRKLCEAMEG